MNDFSVFVSYAHSDNDESWISKFSGNLSALLRKLTGAQPKIFLDNESLVTASIWERKIVKSLESSRLMIAVVSPSYVKSIWCRKEWQMFSQREALLRAGGFIGDEQGLIFPILLAPLGRGSFTADEEIFVTEIGKRQWFDLTSQLSGTPIRPEQVRTIAEQLIDASSDLVRRQRKARHSRDERAPVQTIVDTVSMLEWAAALSSEEMSFSRACEYAALFSEQGWRLPTVEEIESIIDPSAIGEDPDANTFPLKEPFNSQRFGYLHSGTKVNSGNFIMNVRNGHIFNGLGYNAYVRLVRTIGPRPAEMPSVDS